ncbi:DsbA family protein [Cohaesibacter gelatinilyticus]|uniref:Protein-disulfide isomerase n=1 Tax=Cohaesibacter gelatinilyticus TaxID=372072 RepID=A0A285NDE2_9HYPH|nr:DsbA family protein [Cohaesibacter gelatinilyticus]SNZ05936.1 Protein-disulfide isomerase [Cohaesibacter gelatinilyticus]HAT86885.1 DsbA family protein [Hyphomicrobiales bacterium]
MAISRREFLASASALAAGFAAVTALPVSAFAADKVDMDEVLKEGALPDKIQGAADAPVTMVEYSSLTCPHCAAFHNSTYAEVKKKYIDTGKIRYITREFPLDPLAAGGAMLARCAPNDNFHAMNDLLFETQRTWAASPNPVDALLKLAKQVGFTQDGFTKCLQDQKLLDNIRAVSQRGSEKFGIDSTPSFIINGELHRGALSIEDIDKIVAPLIK